MASPNNVGKIWTVLELITWSTSYLQEKNIDEARLTVELMLSHALNMKRIQLYMNFDKPMTADELAAYKLLLKRRLTREPIQYIIGETEFMGLPFIVDARVLIPRPETETLVEEILRCSKGLRPDGGAVTVLDIGTGSGCIAVSIAKLLPGSVVDAVDISAGAIDVARMNAEKNGVAVGFSQTDILSAPLAATYDVLVSNPPYISLAVYATLQPEITEFEPRVAETDGADGLSFYRRLAAIGKTMLNPGGVLAVEHAFDQQDDVMAIFTGAGWSSVVPISDYSGNPRCVIVRDCV